MPATTTQAASAAPAKRPAGQASASAASHAIPIKCVGLSKVFKDFWLRNRVKAVTDLDLEVRRGEVFGLLGPNGSGKSTTIKMILGLLNPTAGKIAVLGRSPNDVSIKNQIGYLPEESYLYRFLTPGETLDYYGKLFGQDRSQRKKRTETLLDMVGLTHAARRPVGEFSKGMQRKVGLAQALINDPDLLILDEPTSGMDPIATAEVKNVIMELKRRGKTILLCSHLLADVQDVCDRVVVMYGGKIREQGSLSDLLQVESKTILETDHLEDHIVTEIEQLLERHGHSILKSEHPRKNLDQLFLEIVEKARTEGARTAGATQGGKIADFLSTSAVPAGTDPVELQQQTATQHTERVLDSLTDAPGTPETPGSDAQSDASTNATSVAPKSDATPSASAVDAASLLPPVEDKPKADAAAEPAPAPAPAPDTDLSQADLGLLGALSGQSPEPAPKAPAPVSQSTPSAAPASDPAANDANAADADAPSGDQSVLDGLLNPSNDDKPNG